jgi:ADP-heptose:LPS heptosyltransferase
VADEDRYFFFESRAYGGDSEDPLPVLASRWMTETFDVDHARTFIAPLRAEEPADVSISFGVGENAEKLVPGNFEPELICALVKRGQTILIDKGSGGDETARVERAIDAAGPSAHITAWHGDYAPFAARIARSNLYVGYDSAGQHVAAACGIPLISIFAGYVSPRMLQRWRPTGAGPITVIPVDEMSPAEVLRQTLAAV